jgi:hypothetical protein
MLCFNMIGFYKISNAWMNLAIMVGPAAGQGLPRNFRRSGRFGGTHGATARINYPATCHTSLVVFKPVAGMIPEGLKRVLFSLTSSFRSSVQAARHCQQGLISFAPPRSVTSLTKVTCTGQIKLTNYDVHTELTH